MIDRRRILSGFAVLALVLLRLAVGWHFFREGTEKVVYDPHDGQLRKTFSAEGFLANAKGPLAGWYRANIPDDHGWRDLLATPRKNDPTEKSAPAFTEWAERIAADWRNVVDDVKALPALADAQKQQADAILEKQRKDLDAYLAAESQAIAEYRHELWRLANWQDSPESGEVPFVDERISAKTLETAKTPAPWVGQVQRFDAELREDLQALLTNEQRELALTTSGMNEALSDPREKRLHVVNTAVTWLTIGVGVCLLVGFFTRTAAIVGALFLLGVILSQPPWLADAAPTMEQIIEFTALLVLAGTGAGRWAGLDFFTYALFNRGRTGSLQQKTK
jgi:uncharacterized membrane protein YphA (DoxX/SURF4 family)